MSAALAAVNARRATARALESLRDEFAAVKAVRLVAAGKAAVGMAEAAIACLGPKLSAGVVTAKVGNVPDVGAGFSRPDLSFFPSSHPLPNDASEAAGRHALALAARTNAQNELLLVCLSGGASAMLSVPAPGLTLADKRAANEHLLRAGLDIGSMNVVRRHLSGIKGGQLAAAAHRTITLAISDVIRPTDDDPLTIGSGPTVGDTTTFEDALQVIERAGLSEVMPAAVMAHLRRQATGHRPQANGSPELGPWALGPGPVAPDDPRLRHSAYWVVCSRQDAMRAAADTARQIGYRVHVHSAALGGEARDAPGVLLDAIAGLERPACVVCSGETTVRVRGRGQGGRNQELCVAALERLHALGSAALASIGTDGVDGPTDAAGGIVDSDSWNALGAGAARTCAEALENNDAYPLLERLGGLIRTGPTGTNVGDLQVLLLT